MNLTDVFTRVTRTFGDEAAIQINKEDVARWCTDAQREIALSAGLMETLATSVITGATENVVMPEDLLALKTVAVQSGTVYKHLQLMNFTDAQDFVNENNPDAVPQYYWTYARTIHFYPIPSGDFNLQLFYNRNPTEITISNEVFDVPIAFHGRIVEYCMKQAYELDENFQAAALKTTEFTDNLSTQANQESDTQQSSYPTIRIMPEDM